MKTFLLLPVLIAYGLSQVQGSLKQLQEMIEKVTGKNALVSYGFYGCHCGLGGHGIPKDATDRILHGSWEKALNAMSVDYCSSWKRAALSRGPHYRCCAAHDCCYSKLVKNSCHPKMEKYDYNYHNDVITCGSGSKCQEQICSCDRTLTYCMLENLRTYNPKYQSFPNILCGGSKPQC